MKVIDNKLVMEKVTCFECKGSGEVTRYEMCPLYDKPVRNYGGKCPHCGSRNKYSHTALKSYNTICPTCKGEGREQEDRYSYLPKRIWESLDFRLTVKPRSLSWVASYLGYGYIFTVTDYGRYNTKTYDEIIADVIGNAGIIQAVKVTKQDGTLCDYVEIALHDDGYTVGSVFKSDDV